MKWKLLQWPVHTCLADHRHHALPAVTHTCAQHPVPSIETDRRKTFSVPPTLTHVHTMALSTESGMSYTPSHTHTHTHTHTLVMSFLVSLSYAVLFRIKLIIAGIVDHWTRSTQCGRLLVCNQAAHVSLNVKISQIESNQAPRCTTLTNSWMIVCLPGVHFEGSSLQPHNWGCIWPLISLSQPPCWPLS